MVRAATPPRKYGMRPVGLGILGAGLSMESMDLVQTVEEFRRDGFVRIPGLLAAGELRALRHDTQLIIDGGYEEVANPTDYRTAPDPDTGEEVFNRVQFVFPLAATDPNTFGPVCRNPTDSVRP